MTTPPIDAFDADERRIIRRCSTPLAVQRWLNGMPYNAEREGPTQRSFRGVVRAGTAHCLEAALSAATILEQHGYPPLVLSFESIDQLDHVIFAYREEGKWGSVARSRDPGLHGRLPVFRRARDLAASYVDGYVDFTGRITAYAVVHLDEAMGRYDWRLTTRNVWKLEQMLIDFPHRPLRTSDARIDRLRAAYFRYKRLHGRKPTRYTNRHTWSELPEEYRY